MDDRTIERMRKMHAEGKSYADIGEAFGVSKGVVSGIAFRRNWPKHRGRSTMSAEVEAQVREAHDAGGEPAKIARALRLTFAETMAAIRRIERSRERKSAPPAPPPLIPRRPVGAGRTCQWPIGTPKTSGFRLCGAACVDHRVYCPEHHRASRVPPKVSA